MEDGAPPSFFPHNPLTKANSLFQLLSQPVCTSPPPLSLSVSLSLSPRGDALISPLPLGGAAAIPACTQLALAKHACVRWRCAIFRFQPNAKVNIMTAAGLLFSPKHPRLIVTNILFFWPLSTVTNTREVLHFHERGTGREPNAKIIPSLPLIRHMSPFPGLATAQRCKRGRS